MKIIRSFFLLVVLFSFSVKSQNYYDGINSNLDKKIGVGWNTWNTKSVLSHVLLPEKFAVDIQLENRFTKKILKSALIGRRGENVEKVKPGLHAYDGSYTELEVEWNQQKIKIETSSKNDDFNLAIYPISVNDSLIVRITPHIIWNGKGALKINSEIIEFSNPTKEVCLYSNGEKHEATKTYLSYKLDKPVFLSTKNKFNPKELEQQIKASRERHTTTKNKFDTASEIYNAMQSVLAWDVIYEPYKKGVITPVSRIWNCKPWNGWVLFDWDTYFAAYMLSVDNKELAYANAVAITKEITKGGFIPNFGSGLMKTEDRSQPPVGSLIVKEIYKKYKEKDLLTSVFDELITWNRWWEKNRDINGYLTWGSDPYTDEKLSEYPDWLTNRIGDKVAAMWETGLDNSPMWDDIVHDKKTHRLLVADVGLMSFYVADCESLAEIASVLGKNDIKKELLQRKEKYAKKLKSLWNEEFGLFLNKDLSTGKPSYRLSPTLFYPLLAKVATQEQAERMINEHYFNPEEFYGDWILPSIARNDPAFKDNTYWRGRIWAPLNLLVYMGIRNYNLPKAQKDLSEKSAKLLLKSWKKEKHIYENYNSITGQGDDVENSDKFYHWGSLLGFISLIEKGYVPAPEKPLD